MAVREIVTLGHPTLRAVEVLSTAPGVMRFVPLRLHLGEGLWEDEPL